MVRGPAGVQTVVRGPAGVRAPAGVQTVVRGPAGVQTVVGSRSVSVCLEHRVRRRTCPQIQFSMSSLPFRNRKCLKEWDTTRYVISSQPTLIQTISTDLINNSYQPTAYYGTDAHCFHRLFQYNVGSKKRLLTLEHELDGFLPNFTYGTGQWRTLLVTILLPDVHGVHPDTHTSSRPIYSRILRRYARHGRASCVLAYPLLRACMRPIFLSDKDTQASRSPQGCDWSANYILSGVTFPVSCAMIPAEKEWLPL